MNHHRPPTTDDGVAAPTVAPSCSGHRPRWSDPLKILSFFFRDPILESRLLDAQQRSTSDDGLMPSCHGRVGDC
ncbi:hypothetical protein GQ457_02G028310 [Hibiscus cannabinus]